MPPLPPPPLEYIAVDGDREAPCSSALSALCREMMP